MEADNGLTTIDVLFDSANFITGTKDYPYFNLSNKQLDNIVGLQLLYVSIPFSYYVNDITKNTFTIVDSNGTWNIVLDPGTYNASNIVTELALAFLKAGVTSSTAYNFFIDSSTAQLVIYNNTLAFTISFPLSTKVQNFGFTNSTSSTNGKLADNTETYVNSGANTNYIYSQGPVSLTGSNQLYVHSPELSTMLNSKVYNDTQSGDILFIVPVSAAYLGINEYEPAKNMYLRCNPISLSNISFFLTLGSQTLYQGPTGGNQSNLSLQGLPFQVGIRFYKKQQNVVGGTHDSNVNEVRRSIDSSGHKRMRM